jgi:phage/plasmid-associated DNA primase
MYATNESDGRLGGHMLAIDTRAVRDLSDSEKAQCRRVWDEERSRLQPEMDRKKRAWLAKQGKTLTKRIPDASQEQIRAILEHRWSGELVGSDVIILNGREVTIAEILHNPDRYDGMTGPDPIEPHYRDGAQTCKAYMNRLNGRPMIYSQAHGGIKYRLWHDTQSALAYLGSLDTTKARAALKQVLRATRPNDNAEAESLLLKLAKLLKTTKKALVKNYSSILNGNIRVATSFTDDFDHGNQNGSSQINDLAHIAAETLKSNELSMHFDGSVAWCYSGTHWEPVDDYYLGNKLREILTEQGWTNETGLTRTTKDSVAALKELTHTQTPIIAREPKPIINCRNGEVHIMPSGDVELREHDPSSGLTYVLPIDYDPNADAPILNQALEGMFWPPAPERMKMRSLSDQGVYEKQYLATAREMRKHIEEVLVYLVVPRRWIPAWFLWIGRGHNGKTFLSKVISLLLNPNTVESDRLKSFAESDFGMERLIGKTLLIDDDLDVNTRIPDGFVKKISESKLLSANRKHKTSQTFYNRCALLLLTNNHPRMTDVSPGTTRRIHSVVFPRQFYAREEIDAMEDNSLKEYAEHDLADPTLIDRIKNELPGVVNTLVCAYQRLVKRGGFLLPKAVKESNDKLLAQSNPLPMFIQMRCATGPAHMVRTSDFSASLRRWIQSEHIHWDPTSHQIRTMMDHLNWNVKNTNGGYDHYVGLELKHGTSDSTPPGNTDNDLDDWDDFDDFDDGDSDVD